MDLYQLASLVPVPIYLAIMNCDSEEERSFLTALYLSYRKELFTYAVRICSSQTNAEDAVQNAFLSIIPKVSTLRAMQNDRLKAYLFVSVRNAVYKIHHSEEKTRRAEIDSMAGAAIEQTEDPLYEYDSDELMQALPLLSERDRTLLHMKYFLQLSDQEIAEQLQLKQDSVKVLISRARQRLMKTIREGDQDHDRE